MITCTVDKLYQISSVLGFSLNIELYDITGNLILSGAKTTYPVDSNELPKISTKLINKKWFSNYNQSLIDKIRDHRRIND